MGLFDFARDVGRKIFDTDAEAADNIKEMIQMKSTPVKNLDVQYDDGTWHVFGIASTVNGGCSGLGTHALLPRAAAWIEEESGLDVTPCFTLNGQWDPDYRCGHFIMSGAETPKWPLSPSSI